MPRITIRAAGWLGILFVVLLFLSAGMVSLPASDGTSEAIAAFYAAHRAVILISQSLGLLAVPVFIAFAFGLEKAVTGSRGSDRIGPVGFAGIVVGAASAGTSIPVLALALTTAGQPFWVRLTDLSDAVLFLAIGVFGAATATRGIAAPVWLRAAAALVAVLGLARSVAGFVGIVSVLDVAVPLAFLAFVLAAGVRLLFSARGTAGNPQK